MRFDPGAHGTLVRNHLSTRPSWNKLGVFKRWTRSQITISKNS